MDQDDLEDQVFTQTILIHAEILYKWQKRYVLQTEVLYALAFVLSVALCWAKKTGFLVLGGPSEESSEQKVADAAVFALKGRRATMEDRFAMIQVPVPHLPDQPIVRIFAILDGHGGQVSILLVEVAFIHQNKCSDKIWHKSFLVLNLHHIVWKLPKMYHVSFSLLAFFTNFCPIKSDLPVW